MQIRILVLNQSSKIDQILLEKVQIWLNSLFFTLSRIRPYFIIKWSTCWRVCVCVFVQSEIQNLKEQLEIEKESWEQNYLKRQESWITQKERELKEQVRKDRDKEIEQLILRLEAESTSSRDELERTAENRIKYWSVETRRVKINNKKIAYT